MRTQRPSGWIISEPEGNLFIGEPAWSLVVYAALEERGGWVWQDVIDALRAGESDTPSDVRPEADAPVGVIRPSTATLGHDECDDDDS